LSIPPDPSQSLIRCLDIHVRMHLMLQGHRNAVLGLFAG
jgi:hypothetical protein